MKEFKTLGCSSFVTFLNNDLMFQMDVQRSASRVVLMMFQFAAVNRLLKGFTVFGFYLKGTSIWRLSLKL